MLVRPQPSQLAPPAAPAPGRWRERSSFLGRLTAGSSALNRRMRGSNPARGARTYGRGHGVHAVSNTAGEGSIPSVRALPRSSSRPGCRPLKPVTRVRIPLGALHATVVSAVARGVASAAGRVRFPAVAFHGALVSTANTRGLQPRDRGSTPRGSTRHLLSDAPGARPGCLLGEAGSIPVESAFLAVAQWNRAPPCDGGGRRFDSSRRDLDDGPAGPAPL